MEINIVGPGSMGLMLAYYLSKANVVNLIVKKEEADFYSNGVAIRENGMDKHIHLPVSTELKSADLTIIAVKSYDLENTIREKRIRGPILLIQNGLTHLMLNYPENDKFYAVSTWGATRISKGKVELTGKGYFRVGGKGKLSIDFLKSSGINAEWSGEIEKEIYRKAGINSAINPLTAIFRVRNGIVAENSFLWNLSSSIIKEDQELFNKMGYDFDLERDVKETCRVTAMNRSSMLQDISNARRTEIDAINGELIRLGSKHGLEMKVNEAMLNSVHFLESMEIP